MIGDLQQHKTQVIWDIQVSSLTSGLKWVLFRWGNCMFAFQCCLIFYISIIQTMDSNGKDVQVQFCHWVLSLCEDQFKPPFWAL